MIDGPLPGFGEFAFEHDGASRRVFTRGEGPGVLLMHEIGGVSPPIVTLGRRLSDAGYTVWVPHLFGTPGKAMSWPSMAATEIRLCISREFVCLATGKTSPITIWLRALAAALSERTGGPVGVVGMCLTGGFALALVLEPSVSAPVMAEPALPWRPFGSAWKRDLGLSPTDREAVRETVETEDLCVLGLRFSRDSISPPERFAALSELLGTRFDAFVLDSGDGTPFPKKAHSVLTSDRSTFEGNPAALAALDEAFGRVLALFRERLGPPSHA